MEFATIQNNSGLIEYLPVMLFIFISLGLIIGQPQISKNKEVNNWQKKRKVFGKLEFFLHLFKLEVILLSSFRSRARLSLRHFYHWLLTQHSSLKLFQGFVPTVTSFCHLNLRPIGSAR